MLSQIRLSVVCLSVCDVGAPYSGGWTFRQFFSPYSTFLVPKIVGGGRPFPPEICVQSDPPPFQTAILRPISAHSASIVIASKKSSIITYRKSTTRFPTSHRWTVYVTPKSPKGGTKSDIAVCASKIQLLSKKVCYKVSLCENFQQQSCSYIILIQRSIDRLRATSPSTCNWRSKWHTPSEDADFQSIRLRVINPWQLARILSATQNLAQRM